MVTKTGMLSSEMVKSIFTPAQQVTTYKAVIECMEAIPCNPCVTHCPIHAITISPNIHAQPILDSNICIGCALCVGVCPGLAIMCAKVNGDKAWFKIPYELEYNFKPGMVVRALNRQGKDIGDATIVSITQHKSTLTTVVEVAVASAIVMAFSTIKEVHDG